MSDVLGPVRRWGSLVVLVGAVLLLAVDANVLYLAVPALTAELSPTSTQVLWVGDIYSLALAGLLVTMGNLADRIGRKRLLLTGSFAFGMASLLAAFAPTPEVLILARLLLGIAGATIMPSTLSLIRNIFTDPVERTRAIAIWSAAAASGIALGPLVGGVLLERFWWGSVFLINLPVMAVVIIVGAWLLPESKNPNPGAFDLFSSLLSMVAIVPFVYTVKQVAGGNLGPSTIAAITISVVGSIWFVRRQRRSSSPMIDVDLFRNPAFTGAVLVNFFAVFAFTGVLFFFSQYLQLARGLTPLEAGIAQLPAALSAMAAVAVVGLLLAKLGRGRAIAFALALGAVGLTLVSYVESAEWLGWVLLAIVPLGMGIGITQTLSVDAVVSAVKPAKAGAAASISETAYELGVALGIAVLGSVISALYTRNLTVPGDLPAEATELVEDSLASASTVLDYGSDAFIAAQHAFVEAMRSTTLIAAGVMLFAAFLAYRLISNTKESVAVDH